MKTWNNLFARITSFENLLLAARRARQGKRLKPGTAAFDLELEGNLLRLQKELQSHTWQPGGYFTFEIYEPKKRVISAAPYRDRVVHHALCNVIEPLFDQIFIQDSYANRQGKGTHRAVDRLTQFCRRNRYVLKCDIRIGFRCASTSAGPCGPVARVQASTDTWSAHPLKSRSVSWPFRAEDQTRLARAGRHCRKSGPGRADVAVYAVVATTSRRLR